jgi:hypothetical protein
MYGSLRTCFELQYKRRPKRQMDHALEEIYDSAWQLLGRGVTNRRKAPGVCRRSVGQPVGGQGGMVGGRAGGTGVPPVLCSGGPATYRLVRRGRADGRSGPGGSCLRRSGRAGRRADVPRRSQEAAAVPSGDGVVDVVHETAGRRREKARFSNRNHSFRLPTPVPDLTDHRRWAEHTIASIESADHQSFLLSA